MATVEQRTGTVKFFRGDRGYGFVTDADGHDYFLHVSEIERAGLRDKIKECTRVRFSLLPGHPKGPKAIQLQIAG